MSLLLDTGILYAYYDRSDRWHASAVALLRGERGLILPSPVIAEVDHLLTHRLGRASRPVFYAGIVDGHYVVADVPAAAYARIAAIDRQFADLGLGFVDAAIVAIAEVARVRRIATTDRRHFGVLAKAFSLELVPEAAQ